MPSNVIVMPGVDPTFGDDVDELFDRVIAEAQRLYEKGFADGRRQGLKERDEQTSVDIPSGPFAV